MNIYNVKGISMFPILKEGDLLIIKKYNLKKPCYKRNDIVVLKSPENSKKYFIKRLIGLPNEKIKNNITSLYINNTKIDKLYSNNFYTNTGISTNYELSDNDFFVLGDNSKYSTDSRHFGPIKSSMIIGKVLLRIWPIHRLNFWFSI